LRRELLGLVNGGGGAASSPGLALAQARALAADGSAVVVPIVTKIGAKLLVLPAAAEERSLRGMGPPGLTTAGPDALMRGNDANAATSGGLAAYNINYLPADQIDRRWPEWLAAIGNLGPVLWERLGAPLDAMLKDSGVKPGGRI